MKIGIDDISIYTPAFRLDHHLLAVASGVPPAKYQKGLGQLSMSVAPPDEDVVTMAAAAAAPLADRSDLDLAAVIVASEGGVDESKSAAMFVHGLLGLPSTCLAYEVKQACSGGMLAVVQAMNIVAAQPGRDVLVIASDIARYPLDSPAVATEGAGACAMLIRKDPRLLNIEPVQGIYACNADDFWRPAYRREAIVDGRQSIDLYRRALAASLDDLMRRTGTPPIDRFCAHLPFARMAEKAAAVVRTVVALPEGDIAWRSGTRYAARIGNTYTAALPVAIASMLDTESGLDGLSMGLYSYGSGCLGMFFRGEVVAGYRAALRGSAVDRLLSRRRALTFADFADFHHFALPADGTDFRTPRCSNAPYRLAGISGHRRCYEAAAGDLPTPVCINELQPQSLAHASGA
jgi:hydroxymethylglutaryl-CoA synthase